MTYELTITRDTGVNSHSLSSYRRLDIVETDAALTDGLTQRGPSYNNQIILRGTFRTMREAVEAAMNYIDAPCKLVETTHWTGDSEISLMRFDAKPKFSDETTVRVLASKSERGTFIASA